MTDPRLSQSVAKLLLHESPLHAWRAHPDLGGIQTHAAKFDAGNLLHKLVLGRGNEIQEIEADSWRTKPAKEARDAARAAKRIPVLAHKLDAAVTVARAIQRRIIDEGILLEDGDAEKRLYWESDGVACAGTPDWVCWPSGVFLDLKTTDGSTSWSAACKQAEDWSIQNAAYFDAGETLQPELTGRYQWIWVYASQTIPGDVGIYRPDGAMLELGRSQWQRAKRKWRRLLDTHKDLSKPWPSHGTQVIEPPAWVMAREETAILMEMRNG